MIQIHTNNTIQSLDENHTKFNEIVQLVIQIKGIDDEQKKLISHYFENEKPSIYQMEIREGPRSLTIELTFEKPFTIQKKEFVSIQTFGSTTEQRKDLKKISKLFDSEFKEMNSVREKQMVSKLYKMYTKELKEGSVGKSKREFKRFLRNILEN